MIAVDEAQRIASGWVDEYSRNPHVTKIGRERVFFHELDGLVYQRPNDALRVFEKMAVIKLSDWTFEGVAGGPVREFLHVYGDKFDLELNTIGVRTPAFVRLLALAKEGR